MCKKNKNKISTLVEQVYQAPCKFRQKNVKYNTKTVKTCKRNKLEIIILQVRFNMEEKLH